MWKIVISYELVWIKENEVWVDQGLDFTGELQAKAKCIFLYILSDHRAQAMQSYLVEIHPHVAV